jgi:outer membrane lipoprotein SlyB
MTMKKYIASLVMMAMMAVAIPFAAATSVDAQTRYTRNGRTYVTRTYTTTTYKRPSFYKRHRNAINIGVGTAAGALLGGLIGGGKGALIGTLIGGGGSALYSYKIKPKRTTYYYR